LPFDQSLAETTPAPKRTLEPGHGAAIALVIVTEKVQQPVKSQDAQLSQL
jgi:hypothetical protein